MREYRIGIPLNDALQNLASRAGSEEVNLMVYSVVITRELGGDISEIFDHLAEIIRSRHRVMERIDTLTAQGRLQARICGGIPFFLYVILYLWSPEFVQPLFKTGIGRMSIVLLLAFQVVLYFVIRKIIAIKI
jgi:tight adherence protein B